MPSATPWRISYQKGGPHQPFSDASIPKLHNLSRAHAAGLSVPPTLWAWAEDLSGQELAFPIEPDGSGRRLPFGFPVVVRSGAATEDTSVTSNAGQFHSEAVERPEDFPAAVGRVIASLPDRRGVVFVQPLVQAERAGVTFFDGFYEEESSAEGGNVAVTSGTDRGEVRRGHLARSDPHSDWLRTLHQTFGGRLDVEWALPRPELTGPGGNLWWAEPGRRVVLQVRPALFPVRRNPTLSLANHKEILGDPPSPWMVGVLAEVARPCMALWDRSDPEIASWQETYAEEVAGRAWFNVAAFFRIADHWGLPRSVITEGVGGTTDDPADARIRPVRLLRNLPRMARLQGTGLLMILTIRRTLRGLAEELEQARTLADLQRFNVRALGETIPIMFALGGTISVLSKVRRFLGFRRGGRVVTQEMMEQYAAIAALPDRPAREAALDRWLAEYGHRGPFESDPARPRFADLRSNLLDDLDHPHPAPSRRCGSRSWIARPLFLADERRESYRHELMRLWQTLRGRILEEASRAVAVGHLHSPDDVFFLRSRDLQDGPSCWKGRVAAHREAWERARAMSPPDTASRDEIEAMAERAAPAPADGVFRGIGLGVGVVEGTAVRADDLLGLLARGPLPDDPILVTPTLEPSWAVVFPRFSAVVADLGGELSHAAILLREAGIPAVVNARGVFAAVGDGDRLRVEPRGGTVSAPPREAEAANPGNS